MTLAEWLGKPEPSQEDIPKYLRDMGPYSKFLIQYFLETMYPMLQIRLTPERFKRFEEAVVKKFGKYSAFNARAAALEALENWSEQNLR
jgi:hypothetical protein